jgi:hypothetical protein
MNDRSTLRRGVVWALQAGLAIVLFAFVGRALLTHWEEFRALNADVTIRPGPIALAALTTLVTYGFLIEAWRRVILGWGERLSYRDAGYIWTVSNLGRYIPGKIWTVAGLVALARRAGVRAGTATASGLAMQALAVGTGAAVMASGLPRESTLWATVAAALLTAGVVGVLVWEPAGARLMRLLGGGAEARGLPLGTALLAGGATLASWVTHGVSFWLVSRGVLAGTSLAMSTAIATFAAGYVLGLLALFAPGGLGVREAVLATVLTPIVGAGGAVVLSVASRLFLTVMEVGVAALAVASRAGAKETTGV